MASQKKIIVIGLDGATWDVITPWIEEGVLPTFQRICATGTWGVLKSTNPPLTTPGWPAFFTGKNPGKHGVYDFLEPQGDRISTGAMVRTETLWEILSRSGKRCIVQNVPVTFPARKINGIMITDMMAAPGEVFTHPAELTAELNSEEYKIDVLFDRPKEKKKEEVIALVNEIEQNHMEVFQRLLKEHEWDFAMLAITGPDRLQHYYWDDKPVLQAHYQLVDQMIGKLMDEYGDDCAFVFLSDHGFCSKTTELDLNLWLEQQGYLAWKKAEAGQTDKAAENWQEQQYYKTKTTSLKKRLQQLGITHELIQRHWLLKKLSKLIPRHVRKKLGKQVAQSARVIDWSRTVASIPTGIVRGINLNLVGRDAHGIVAQVDYERVRGEIIAELAQIRTPSGGRVFNAVLTREEAYIGPFVNEAYDIVFELEDASVLPVAKKNKSLFSPSRHAGYHHEDGMYALCGHGFTSLQNQPRAKLEDLAPTILHYFDLPVPSDMDGRVIQDAFTTQKEVRFEQKPHLSSEKKAINSALKGIKL